MEKRPAMRNFAGEYSYMSHQKGFERYPFPERVLSELTNIGFRRPTRVQEKVIPIFLQKRNMIVEAPTGTGKTAAYGLPLISRLDLLKRSTQALVLAPSRELALQITKALNSYYEGDQLRVGAVYGGVSMQESNNTIKSAPHILVAVPGRLIDALSHQPHNYLWRDIKFLMVDEADKLLESGFQREFDEIRQKVRKKAQIGFFSATISPDSVALIRDRVKHCELVRLSPQEMLRNISFGYVKVPSGQQARYLAALLDQKEVDQALIFCGKREEIYSIIGFLRNGGLKAEAYYGLQDQTERENILKRFREGHIQYLVASDLAARGLDIPDLPAVINLSIPEEFDYYLHRVGRTGRAGKSGRVFNVLVSGREESFLKNHHRAIELPIRTIPLIEPAPDILKTDAQERWIKVHLSRGKRDKIRKGDIAGFLIQNGHLEMEELGTITIYDNYALVDIPFRGLETLDKQAADLKIKGKKVKVRRYKQDEQEKRANALKELKKDRKKPAGKNP